jgi:hypothetical protein
MYTIKYNKMDQLPISKKYSLCLSFIDLMVLILSHGEYIATSFKILNHVASFTPLDATKQNLNRKINSFNSTNNEKPCIYLLKQIFGQQDSRKTKKMVIGKSSVDLQGDQNTLMFKSIKLLRGKNY